MGVDFDLGNLSDDILGVLYPWPAKPAGKHFLRTLTAWTPGSWTNRA
jgi:hypothetical protein